MEHSRKWYWSVFPEEERKIYSLYVKPKDEQIHWKDSALLVVDFTESFVGEDTDTVSAATAVRSACGKPAWDAARAAQPLLEAYRQQGRPVVYVVPEALDTRAQLGDATVGTVQTSRVGSDEVVEGLGPAPNETVIAKARASAFFGTLVTSVLIRLGVKSVAVIGGTTSGCVRASCLDGSSLGFQMVLIEDGCFDRSQLSHAVALSELETKYASVVTAAEGVKALVG